MKNEFAIYINIALLLSSVTMVVLQKTHQIDIEKQLKQQQLELAQQQARSAEIKAAAQRIQPAPERVEKSTAGAFEVSTSNHFATEKSNNTSSVVQYHQSFPASAQAEVHAIGVYQADIPNKVVWWDKCGDMPRNECFKKYAGQHEEGVIQVNVSYSSNPIILALMSYEPVQWVIQPNGARIEAVILAGYHGQSISGLSPTIPVRAYTYKNSQCGSCSKGDGYFFGYKLDSNSDFAKKIFDITGKRLSSFQGSYTGSSFSINDYTPKLDIQTVATP